MRHIKITATVGVSLLLLGIVVVASTPKLENYFSDRKTNDNTKEHFETTVRDIKSFGEPTSFVPEYDFTRTSGTVWPSRAQISANLKSSYNTDPSIAVEEVTNYLRKLEGYISKKNWNITYQFNGKEYSSVDEFIIDSNTIDAVVTNCENTDRFASISTTISITESSYEVDMMFVYTPKDSDKRGIFWCSTGF